MEAVSVRELTFSYEGGEGQALQDINLVVQEGEFLVITGPSGCGKSTLALCLAGFIPHAFAGEYAGSVRVHGIEVSRCGPVGLARHVGLVQQDPEAQLCTMSVADELAFGPENLCLAREEVNERVRWAAEAVGVTRLLGRTVHTLSGGEKQRVAIAAILAMQPSVLVLDEPTANLDPHGAREVIGVVEQLCREQGIAVILIEHRLEAVAAAADRLVRMDSGQITAVDNPREFLEQYRPSWLRAGAHGSDRGPRCRMAGEVRRDVRDDRKPALSVRSLSLHCGARRVLADIDFDVYDGEVVAVMGDNGSGKTSLLFALLGIVRPTAGAITVDGEDITSRDIPERARMMGLGFQNPNHQLFERTVEDEVILPSRHLLGRDVPPGEVRRMLNRFGLLGYRRRPPFALSLGEKKRVALASLLLYSPRFLLLDEPLLGQDDDQVDLLLRAVRCHAGQGGIAIVVCHNPDFVLSTCDRVLFLENGMIEAAGTPQRVFASLAHRDKTEYLPWGFATTCAR